MKKKPVDQFYLVEMYNLWKSYPAGSKSRGEVVRRFMSERGVSKVYVHKVFNEHFYSRALNKVHACCPFRSPLPWISRRSYD